VRIHRSILVFVITLSVFLVGGAWAQEAPESPEAPETPETPAAEEALEAEDAPEATEAPEAPAAPSLVFETTVDFAFVKKTPLDGQAGEVEIRAVEFTSSSGKGGMFSSGDKDLYAGVVAKLECSTTAETKQKPDLVFEFLDKEGALIDRAKNGVSFKKGTKNFETDLKTLKYAVPLIAQVRITASASEKN